MGEGPRLNPVEYLDRFFDELRAEVRSNPQLAARLVRALGGNVVFEDGDKAAVANPYALAEGTKSNFISVFGAMKLNDIKKILKDHNLATKVDMNGKNAQQLVEMMYDRAAMKVHERKSSVF
jgi:hypothetical protein